MIEIPTCEHSSIRDYEQRPSAKLTDEKSSSYSSNKVPDLQTPYITAEVEAMITYLQAPIDCCLLPCVRDVNALKHQIDIVR
jgi:hypothetical protein